SQSALSFLSFRMPSWKSSRRNGPATAAIPASAAPEAARVVVRRKSRRVIRLWLEWQEQSVEHVSCSGCSGEGLGSVIVHSFSGGKLYSRSTAARYSILTSRGMSPLRLQGEERACANRPNPARHVPSLLFVRNAGTSCPGLDRVRLEDVT